MTVGQLHCSFDLCTVQFVPRSKHTSVIKPVNVVGNSCFSDPHKCGKNVVRLMLKFGDIYSDHYTV
jgi:hypothetical protein